MDRAATGRFGGRKTPSMESSSRRYSEPAGLAMSVYWCGEALRERMLWNMVKHNACLQVFGSNVELMLALRSFSGRIGH